MILITGANIPLDQLPAPLAALGRRVPMTHGLEAVRRAIAGDTSGIAGLLGIEVLVGVIFTASGIVLFRYAERRARRTGSIHLWAATSEGGSVR